VTASRWQLNARGDVAGHDLLQADLLQNGVGAVA